MITPFEIENKDFSKSMRGYNIEEVDEFLDEIILDLQKLLVENEKMKDELNTLNTELTQYKKSESSVLNTLESAKKLMNDISESAEKRAEVIIRNAQMDAEVIRKDAKDSIAKLTEEGERLREKVFRFRDRYKQMLENEISSIESSGDDLFSDIEKEFVPASMAQSGDNAKPPETEKPSEEIIPADAGDISVSKPARKAKETVVMQKTSEPKPQGTSKDTLVMDDNSLDKLLAENFGVKSTPKADLQKTRMIK